MSHTKRLLKHLLEQAPVSGPRKDVTDSALAEALARLRPAAEIHELFATMLERDTSFAMFDIEMYPTILLRTPWKAGVLGENEVCVGKNGGGDLWLFDVVSGKVRFVVHDEDWAMRSRCASFDAFLEEVFWQCLEHLDADELDDASPEEMARIRCALDIGGVDALNDDVREKLVELAVLPE